MKRLYMLFGLLLFGLLLHSGLADISLTLQDSGDGQSYLPPPIEDISSQQHHSFQESNFGDSHYPIFEVHNHFTPSSNQQLQHQQQQHPATQSNYEAQGYLPPTTQEIHIQHVNHAQHANDDHLDVSLLSFVAGGSADGQQVIIGENVPRAPATTALPVPATSSYQHEFQKTNIRSGKLLEEGVFRGPDYLPPNRNPSGATQKIRIEHVYPSHTSSNQQLSDPRQSNFRASEYLPPSGAEPEAEFRAPDYLPPHHHSNNEVQNEPRFKGPDYLPPYKGTKAQTHEQHFGAQSGGNQVYRAPGYLPPQTGGQGNHHQSVGQTNFKGSDYLPPHRESYKGPDYLPPHVEAPQKHHASQNNYHGPDYLPPHEEVQQQYHTSYNNYKAPDYLPPHQEHNVAVGQNNYEGPDYLPPHTSDAEYRAPGHLPQGYDFTNPEEKQVQNHVFQAPPSQEPPTFQGQGVLPSGYDFIKPPNSEQAIALLHSQPSSSPVEEHQQQQEVVVGTQIEVAEREQEPDIIYGHYSQSGGADLGSHFDAEGKSAPISTAQPQTNYQVSQGDVQAISNYNGFEPSIPSNKPPQQQDIRIDYLSPPVAPSTQNHMHSLSSYMTAVQPFGQRYGDAQFTEPRKPFAHYGPPPGQHAVAPQSSIQQPATAIDVAPMFREQATRSQYYAPGMSYGANAYTNQHQQQFFHEPTTFSFNEQTKQTLQRLMPKDIKVQNQVETTAQAPTATSPAVPAAGLSASGKIRTVQIINPNQVKTLKVLVTSDHAGVKTIKILGASNENPTGEHHIVNVVNENHVQTVKIYNDQQEVSLPVATTSETYLPPTVVARATIKRSVRVA